MNEEKEDIRWIQRFNNFEKALKQLSRFIEKGQLNEFEKQGLIQSFEYTYELAWNTIKDYFELQGEINIMGSRDAFRVAFRRGVIIEGEIWMDMIKSRIASTHTYKEEIAEKVADDITKLYFAEFNKLYNYFAKLKAGNG